MQLANFIVQINEEERHTEGAAAEVEELGETSREEYFEKTFRITMSNATENLNNMSKKHRMQFRKMEVVMRRVLLLFWRLKPKGMSQSLMDGEETETGPSNVLSIKPGCQEEKKTWDFNGRGSGSRGLLFF